MKEVTALLSELFKGKTADSLLVDSIQNRLAQAGFLNAELSRRDDLVTIRPGSPTTLRSIIVSDTDSDTIHVSTRLTQENGSALIQKLLSRYESDGHYYAQLKTDSVVFRGVKADLYLSLNRGPVVTLEQVEPVGLKQNDPSLVNRLLSQSFGQPLTAHLIKRTEQTAAGIDWLTFLPPAEVIPNPGYQSAALRFHFIEKRRFTLFGGFGYQSADNTGLVWHLSANLRSLFGRGRSFQVDSERRERGNQTLNLGYRQPLLWPARGKLSVNLATRDYQNQFSEFKLESQLAWRLGSQTDWGVKLGFNRVEPVGFEPGHARYMVGLELLNSTLSDHFNPRSGYELTLGIDYVYRRYTTDSLAVRPEQQALNETRLTAAIGRYTPVSQTIVLKAKASFEGLESVEQAVPLSELVFVGGNNNLRGYRNDQFAARRVGFATLEPRFRFRDGYLFLFYDAAYMGLDTLTEGDYQLVDQFEFGYGLGLALRGENNGVMLSFGWQPELGIDQPRLNITVSADL